MNQRLRNWRTWRVTHSTPNDTALTNYQPGEVGAAARAKMIYLGQATAVALRAFGRDTAAEVTDIVLTGFMGSVTPSGGTNQASANVGAGHRLWRGRLTLGTKALASGQRPTDDHAWKNDAAWLEVDSWNEALGSGYDAVGATRIEVTNQESCLILPVFPYTALMLEMLSGGGMSALGVLWTPISWDIGQWI